MRRVEPGGGSQGEVEGDGDTSWRWEGGSEAGSSQLSIPGICASKLNRKPRRRGNRFAGQGENDFDLNTMNLRSLENMGLKTHPRPGKKAEGTGEN